MDNNNLQNQDNFLKIRNFVKIAQFKRLLLYTFNKTRKAALFLLIYTHARVQ